jgi:hypothetical protein
MEAILKALAAELAPHVADILVKRQDEMLEFLKQQRTIHADHVEDLDDFVQERIEEALGKLSVEIHS